MMKRLSRRRACSVLALLLAAVLMLGTVSFATGADVTSDGNVVSVPLNRPEGARSPDIQQELWDALMEADIATLSEALYSGLISCSELTAFYLERIEAYNKDYNCFITLCDNAMEEAAKRDEAFENGTATGLLFGIPIVVKDNMHYKGYKTTNGLEKSASKVSTVNADVVQYMLNAGAVILGKTNMSTEAQYASHSRSRAAGETLNAYNLKLSPGGSSGGSACAVSLNFAAAGLGTDTNSSLRIPATYNGCVALRPTTGLISIKNIMPLNTSRDVPGAITRTVKDNAIMLDVLTGGKYSYADNLDADALKGVRLGVILELSDPEYTKDDSKAVNPQVTAAFQNALRELEMLGAEIVEISVPGIARWSDNIYADTSKKQTYLDKFAKVLSDNDVAALLYIPVTSGAVSAQKYPGYAFSDEFTNKSSKFTAALGVPEISVPIGQEANGCGIGMEIVTGKNGEQLLLNLAYAYTEGYQHRAVPEGAPSLHKDTAGRNLEQLIVAYMKDMAKQRKHDKQEESESVPQEESAEQPIESELESELESEEQSEQPGEESGQSNPPAPAKKTDTGTVILLILIFILLLLALYLIFFGGALKKKKRRKKKKKKDRHKTYLDD